MSPSNFLTFSQEQSTRNNKEKGNAFEQLVYAYFKLEPKYAFYDEVWPFSDVPSLVLHELKLPSQDIGIDLIAKMGDEYHAIQCKYHQDNSQSVTFKEVSTFISLLESNPKITQGYICSTADITSRVFNKLNTKPINLLLNDTWAELDATFFARSKAFFEGKKPKELVSFKPKDHQKKALKNAKNYFIKENNSRGKLIFPCGAGKSLTGYWITKELASKKTIIAVPSLSLVKQTLEVYLREVVATKRSVKWLCICSDEGIGKDDDVVYFTENIGVPCQTDPEYIKKWLDENRDEEIFIFTTYQSGRIIAEISKQLDLSFDLGIFDEAHKTVGANKKLFSHLLFEQNISIAKRVFMTATERFYKGSKDDIISMDDDDIYGDTFAHMSFKEAIETGLLTDYKVITIEIQKSEIAEFIRENNLVQLNDKWKKETEARSMASMLALRKAMKMFPIKNAVSFHSSIEKAVRNKELQQYITDTYDYQPIDTFTVSGKQATSKRNSIVQEFARSEHSLITNARCLTEGVDVPNIDCIIFSDPRKSKVDIVQALGRALRKKEGKDWGYVILPIIYDDTTQEIDNNNFQEILSIVRGLASNDERIVEFFKDKEQPINKRKIKDGQFHLEVFSDFLDERELANQLNIKLWEKLSRFNWMPFEEAKEYLKSFKFQSQNEFWEAHRQGAVIKSIPYSAHQAYVNQGFTTYSDFLSYSGLFRERLDYNEAKEIIRKLGITTTTQWRQACKDNVIPLEIPYRPDSYYKDSGWVNWSVWFGKKGKNDFYTFEEAKNQVKKLNFNSVADWTEFIRINHNEFNFPKTPNQFYKNKGWIDWGDFLGTGFITSKNRNYKSFEEAKRIVHAYNLKSQKEWIEYCKNPDFPNDIPKSPSVVYKGQGWVNMFDWLGIKSRWVGDQVLLNYLEAIEFVHKLEFKNWHDWRFYTKDDNFPDFIPKQPNKYYMNNGWVNWGEWLGNGKVSTKELEFLPYEEAREFVHKLGFKSTSEWRKYCKKRPKFLPASPEKVYKDKGWINFGDFIGTNNFRNKDRVYLSFEQSLLFSRSLNLMNEKEWRNWKKHNTIPENIPAKPEVYYKDSGWCGYSFWLKNELKISNSKKNFLEFDKAKLLVRELGFKTVLQWKEYCKSNMKPINIPSDPERVYKLSGWKNMGDWLGVEITSNRNKIFLAFAEAREIIRKLNLINQKQWIEYCNSGQKPNNIPSNPQFTYKNIGWLGFGDWLGTGNLSNRDKRFFNFHESRRFVHGLKLNSVKEWTSYCKSSNFNSSIPTNPNVVYKMEWKSWADFLGKE